MVYRWYIYSWLVVSTLPLWKIWVRQWEGWHPMYIVENKIHGWNHQPDWLIYEIFSWEILIWSFLIFLFMAGWWFYPSWKIMKVNGEDYIIPSIVENKNMFQSTKSCLKMKIHNFSHFTKDGWHAGAAIQLGDPLRPFTEVGWELAQLPQWGADGAPWQRTQRWNMKS